MVGPALKDEETKERRKKRRGDRSRLFQTDRRTQSSQAQWEEEVRLISMCC